MQVLFSTIGLVWYDSGAPGTSMAHAWTSAAKLVMGQGHEEAAAYQSFSARSVFASAYGHRCAFGPERRAGAGRRRAGARELPAFGIPRRRRRRPSPRW